MRRPAAGVMLLACLALLVACSGSRQTAATPPSTVASPEQPGGHDDGERQRYVALGDSFTAAPLVPVTDLAEGCLRSDGNYPSLLAARLDLELRDVSCSGASTTDLVRRQRTVQGASVRPQLSALDERADLVTIGIGGNDLGLFSRLVQTCLRLGAQDPTGAPCAESAAGRQLLAGVPRIEVKLERVLRTIQDLAPRARVVVVGYPRIAPAEGSCPRLLPVAAGDVAFGDELLRALDQAMSDAAAAAGVDYLDLYAASSGHDVCSEEPWVNGRHTRAGVALAFHPLAAGAEATADLLEDLLTSS